MASSSTAQVNSTVKLTEDSGVVYPPLSAAPTFAPPVQAYANGTAAGQIDIPYTSRITIASGTPVSLDLSAGGLKDLVGNNANFVKVNTLGFYNRGTNIVNLTGNFVTSRFGASFSMPLTPGGRFLFDDPSLAGQAVTNSTADTLTLTSTAGSNDVDVVIAGRSA